MFVIVQLTIEKLTHFFFFYNLVSSLCQSTIMFFSQFVSIQCYRSPKFQFFNFRSMLIVSLWISFPFLLIYLKQWNTAIFLSYSSFVFRKKLCHVVFEIFLRILYIFHMIRHMQCNVFFSLRPCSHSSALKVRIDRKST